MNRRIPRPPATPRGTSPLLFIAIGAAIAGGVAYCIHTIHAQREEDRRVQEYIAEEERRKADLREQLRVKLEQDAEAEESRRRKSRSEAEAFEAVLEENTRRVMRGERRTICQSCLGRGITKDEGAPRTCPWCKGSGERR